MTRLIKDELAPFDAATRVEITGPNLTLPPPVAQAIAITIHELTTNAAKHGSLSVEGGHVTVSWNVQDQGGERLLCLEWCERNGPPVTPPTREGFGSRLLERVLSTHANAKVNADYRPEGLCFVAEMALHDARV